MEKKNEKMKKSKQKKPGHVTKIGHYKNLVVRWEGGKTGRVFYTFYNEQKEYESWSNDLIARGTVTIQKQYIFQDITYLLNEMVRNKGNSTSYDLFSIFKENYTDEEYCKKIAEFLEITEE